MASYLTNSLVQGHGISRSLFPVPTNRHDPQLIHSSTYRDKQELLREKADPLV